MDKHNRYRALIQQLLREYAAYARRSPSPGTEILEIYDPKNDQFLIRDVGWSGHKRIRVTTLHVRLVGDKIHIEEDRTEEGIATDLMKAGVPSQDIVIAFHPPNLRQLTDFAVA